jgi:type I restriction enzyme S subunit
VSETAPRLDLRPDHWAIVRRILRRHVPDRKVLAFGSRATWTAKDYSDLDLAILGDEPLSLDAMSALAEGFRESDLPFKVDLVDWARIDEAFRNIVRRDGVYVQTRGAVSASAKHLDDSLNVDWRTATIEEVSEKVAMGPFGSSIKVETFVPEGIPIVSGQHLHGTRVDDSPGHNFISEDHAARLSKAIVRRGDIVFTHRGTIGQVAYIPMNSEFERYIISQSQFFMRCDKSNAIPEFVTAYFKSPEGQYKLLANASQVGVPSIAQPVTYLRAVEIPLPPISEQRSIAHILGTLDDKIELNRRMNQTLEAMARAIFKDWFVDFGPVRAKMEEREPYLPPEIWGLFPDALDEEGKPKGWTFDTLARLAITNCESWTARHHPPVVEYVDLSNTKWGNINATTFLDWETAPSRARRIAKAGDTIVGTTRPGNGSFAYISRDGLTVSTGFAVLSPNTAKYRDAVYLATTSTENIKRLADLADGHGGAYPAVKPNEVTDTVIVFPGDEVLASFSDLVSPTRKKIEHARVESGTLGQIRDFLVPKLISGEFRVSDAERIVERAT